MNYCSECGTKLIYKEDGIDGNVPYCPNCKQFRYPMFNSAISTIIFIKDKILLIKQYQQPFYVLVAGYLSKGEDCKQALVREIKEETNLDCVQYVYNDNFYYNKTNTLMHNYIAYCNGTLLPNNEIDSYELFDIHDAYMNIIQKSLAKKFLFLAIIKLHKEKAIMKDEQSRIVLCDSEDEVVSYLKYSNQGDYELLESIFVNEEYRGNTIASSLIDFYYERCKKLNIKVKLKCSYAIKKFNELPYLQEVLYEKTI